MTLTGITSNGIDYSEAIVSINGAAYVLFPGSEHTPDMIKAAKREIRNNFDVVSMRVATPGDWDELYRADIYRQRETRHLKWFQINDDPDLIRKERLKGTSVADFVRFYVLPYTAEVEQRFRDKYGDQLDKM